MFIRNIRKMKISSNSTVMSDSYAFGSGGDINYECDIIDVETCELELEEISIVNNTALFNGGGIYWPNKKPVFRNTTFEDN